MIRMGDQESEVGNQESRNVIHRTMRGETVAGQIEMDCFRCTQDWQIGTTLLATSFSWWYSNK